MSISQSSLQACMAEAYQAMGIPADVVELKRHLRQAELELAAVPSFSVKPWSPVNSWLRSIKSPFARRVSRLQKQLAIARGNAHMTLAPAKLWKPRPASKADARIASKFRSVEATLAIGSNWLDKGCWRGSKFVAAANTKPASRPVKAVPAPATDGCLPTQAKPIAAPRTPALQQYDDFKKKHPAYVLFFRMGDFYEMFHEDARLASRVLGITLTTRGDGANAVAMAGVPVHTVEQYLRKMIVAGHRVALCEQTAGASREITRLMTPAPATIEPAPMKATPIARPSATDPARYAHALAIVAGESAAVAQLLDCLSRYQADHPAAALEPLAGLAENSPYRRRTWAASLLTELFYRLGWTQGQAKQRYLPAGDMTARKRALIAAAMADTTPTPLRNPEKQAA